MTPENAASEMVQPAEPRITEERGERPKPPKGGPEGGDKSVDVEHPGEHDVYEEALGLILRLPQVTMFQIGGDHTGVVRPDPTPT